jgi:hypothetical protein
VIGVQAKSDQCCDFLDNTWENNILLPGSNGLQYSMAGAGCTGLVVRNNIIADSFWDGCDTKSVTGNIFLMGANTETCPDYAYNIWTVNACSSGGFLADESSLFVGGGDYHSKPGSPAINADPSCPPPTIDKDGVARPSLGSACDIGPYETG